MVTFSVQATGPIFEDPSLATRFDDEIVAMLADVGAYAQRLAVDKAPTGVTFALRGSIVSELRGSPAERAQEVSSSLAYAPIQEVGRRPGRRPPAGALLVWVARKLQVGPAEIPSVAFLVARKIGREGTTGYHFMELAFEQASPYFERQADLMVAKYADEANG
jgi:hypothetical protein